VSATEYSASSLASVMSVKASVTCVTQMAVTCRKHMMFLSCALKEMSLTSRSFSRCSSVFLFTEVLSSVKWPT